jgi:predicted heme/steroid binding protein
MKNAFSGFVLLLASALAFSAGNISAALSAGNDLSSALGRDAATGLPYLRVYVVNGGTASSGAQLALAPAAAHTVTLLEGSSMPIAGTLTAATAIDRPCDLIIFENGQSQIIRTSTSGTPLRSIRVAGTVSASGNPLGYTCSIVLKYTTP